MFGRNVRVRVGFREALHRRTHGDKEVWVGHVGAEVVRVGRGDDALVFREVRDEEVDRGAEAELRAGIEEGTILLQDVL